MANLRADEKQKIMETVRKGFKERIDETRREVSEKVSQEMQEYLEEVREYAKHDFGKYVSEANDKYMEITKKALAEVSNPKSEEK